MSKLAGRKTIFPFAAAGVKIAGIVCRLDEAPDFRTYSIADMTIAYARPTIWTAFRRQFSTLILWLGRPRLLLILLLLTLAVVVATATARLEVNEGVTWSTPLLWLYQLKDKNYLFVNLNYASSGLKPLNASRHTGQRFYTACRINKTQLPLEQHGINISNQ